MENDLHILFLKLHKHLPAPLLRSPLRFLPHHLRAFQHVAQGAGEPIQPPDDHGGDALGTAVGNELLQAGAVHVFAGIAAVGVDFKVVEALDDGIGV